MNSDTYEAGMEVATELQALDGPHVNPACHTRLYTHGRQTEHALLLLHGFTNCPQQFNALGRHFHEMGWNVLIPRYPRHGHSDRLSTAIAELRAQHLIAVADRSAEAASGLGERLSVAGLSLGGVLAGHLAQNRDGVERAVLIAPMFGLRPIPAPALSALARAAKALPNFYIWWNNEQKQNLGPPHGYPRFATHGYAAVFDIGAGVIKAARKSAPRARHISVITNASEPRLDNRFTYGLVDAWRTHGAKVTAFEFPASDRLPHDLIDPADPAQNTEVAYPVVMRAITGER